MAGWKDSSDIVNEEVAVISTGTHNLDAATYTGFHYDIAAATTLAATGVTDGHLYTMALDGTAAGHVVTFGSGFETTAATLTTGVFDTNVLVFMGHDGKLCELSRAAVS